MFEHIKLNNTEKNSRNHVKSWSKNREKKKERFNKKRNNNNY